MARDHELSHYLGTASVSLAGVGPSCGSLTAVREELESKRAREIRGMFSRIAHRYDLLNRVLSLGQDVLWRRAIARRVRRAHPALVLDICTGTGDVALSFPREIPGMASDFCVPMLVRASQKAREKGRRLPLFAGDALELPLPDAVFDMVTVAFGVRNFESLERGLTELVRVLRPGGWLVILEFSHPHGVLAPLLGWWERTVPPRVGRWLSGDPEAYSYLPASVESFPDAREMSVLLSRLGLTGVRASAQTGGVATLYEGRKADRHGGER